MNTHAKKRHTLAHLLDEREELIDEAAQLFEAGAEAYLTGEDTDHAESRLADINDRLAELEEAAVVLAFEAVPILVAPHLPTWLKERMFEDGRSYPIQPR